MTSPLERGVRGIPLGRAFAMIAGRERLLGGGALVLSKRLPKSTRSVTRGRGGTPVRYG
jgi:hypothetical protein